MLKLKCFLCFVKNIHSYNPVIYPIVITLPGFCDVCFQVNFDFHHGITILVFTRLILEGIYNILNLLESLKEKRKKDNSTKLWNTETSLSRFICISSSFVFLSLCHVAKSAIDFLEQKIFCFISTATFRRIVSLWSGWSLRRLTKRFIMNST